MNDSLIAPHGGSLVERMVPSSSASGVQSEAARYPRIDLDSRETADLELMAVGALSPIGGFMGAKDYQSVLSEMRLASGLVWTLPITLAVDDALKAEVSRASGGALYSQGRPWGLIRVSEIHSRDPLAEARAVYGTEDRAHPGVAYLLDRPRWLVGGEVQVVPLPEDLPFAALRLTPRALRQAIAERGWKRIAGFQTRNPIHRAHEYVSKLALEFVDGLVIHPLVGQTKDDDVPADVRFETYQVLLRNYYPSDRTLLSVFPAAMRYAGPREAIFHALVRKNYGMTHLVVGRDHAGVGKFYGPFDSQRIFDRFEPGELGVTPLKFDATFFCRRCESMASARTCPHDASARLELSGSRTREILRSGGDLPREFTRPEVAEILRAHYSGARVARA